jgi:hypothetical protein
VKSRCLAAFLAVCSAAFAGDAEFDRVVKAIESAYGTRQTHIPFRGVANLFLKVSRPAGASEFKLAVFENLDPSRLSADPRDFDRLMSGASSGGLHPMVRVRSRRSAEATYIYASEAGHATRMLIATFGSREATVVQVKIDADTLIKCMRDPESAGKMFSGGENE